jgi:hypothetical protein
MTRWLIVAAIFFAGVILSAKVRGVLTFVPSV